MSLEKLTGEISAKFAVRLGGRTSRIYPKSRLPIPLTSAAQKS
jgi:hypothetical protein